VSVVKSHIQRGDIKMTVVDFMEAVPLCDIIEVYIFTSRHNNNSQ